MKYIAPKAIASHPGVLECDSGYDGGSDYKHDVILKEGWCFKYGRMANSRTGFFNSVIRDRKAYGLIAPIVIESIFVAIRNDRATWRKPNGV